MRSSIGSLSGRRISNGTLPSSAAAHAFLRSTIIAGASGPSGAAGGAGDRSCLLHHQRRGDLLGPVVSDNSGGDYLHTETLEGAKTFALWPLSQAAQSCFGKDSWPDQVAAPRAWPEFDVDNVEQATRELESQAQPFLRRKVFSFGHRYSRWADHLEAHNAAIPNYQIVDSPYFHPHSSWSYGSSARA